MHLALSLGSFGDRRLEKGGPAFWKAWWLRVRCACAVLPAASARMVRFDRFLAYPAVTVERLIEHWGELTALVVADREVLAIHAWIPAVAGMTIILI